MTTKGRNVEAIYPLTPPQEGILFHVLYDSSSPLYVQQYSVRLDGDIDTDVLKESWNLVTERHQALRALFLWEGRERPLQVVRSKVEPEWVTEDWRGATVADQADRLTSFLEEDRRRGFTLNEAPLMRFALFRLADERYRFVWSHHHLILDGWSLGVIMREVMQCYGSLLGGTSPTLDPPASFGSYIEWLEGRNHSDRQAAFWSNYLSGFDGANVLPNLGPGPPERWARGQAEHTHHIGGDLPELIRRFSRRHGITISTIMRGAWALVLSRYTGDDDVVFGATVSGRPPDLPGSLETAGLFINTLPVRVRIDQDQRIAHWLRDLQLSQAEMTDFESTPLVEVKRHSDIEPDQQLFESILVMENIPDPAQLDGPISQSDAHYHQQSNYPLAVLAMPAPELKLVCLYDDRRLTRDLIARMMKQLDTTIREICTRSDDAVGSLRLLPHEELERILINWNQPDFDIPYKSILDLIEPHFESARDRPAAVSDAGSLTYGELDLRTSHLAKQLSEEGVNPGDRVGVVMGRSPGMVVAMLAVMKIRAAYVPLEPRLPESRLDYILDDTGATAMVTSKYGTHDRVPALRVNELGVADDRPAGAAVDPADGLFQEMSGEDLAYVMYTSGSTGEPKGVEITQRNLLASTLARISHYDAQPGRYLVLSPFTFDSSVAGIYWTLAAGGTLVLPGPDKEGDVAHISRLIQDERVTHMLTLPTIYRLILEHTAPSALGSLEVVIVAGEACPPSVVEDHDRHVAGAKLFNEYGPTEGTVWVTVEGLNRQREEEERRISIGRPIPGAQAYLLDDHLRPVPVGAQGEIWIGGAGVARGYLGRPNLTAQRFPTVELPMVGEVRLYRTGDVGRWRDDGRLELLGRMDHQVKVRGQRVELEEIETNMKRHPEVTDAVVTVHRPEIGSAQLVAYVDGTIEASKLRRFLSSLLPEVMVPTRIVQMSPLPRLSSGKIDRKNLPTPEGPASAPDDPVAPRGEIETRLARIWAEVLGRNAVGAKDNFFELGGDSILSIRIIARANEAGLKITPRQFFEHPTVAEMAAVAERA